MGGAIIGARDIKLSTARLIQAEQRRQSFKLEPGWHIYWKTPETQASRRIFIWALPGGRLTVVPMRFPAPKRLPLGPLMDFGYDDEVLFPIKLHVDPTVKDGKAVLNAKVDWLVGREVCIPGKTELETTLQLFSGHKSSCDLLIGYGCERLVYASHQKASRSAAGEFQS